MRYVMHCVSIQLFLLPIFSSTKVTDLEFNQSYQSSYSRYGFDYDFDFQNAQ